MVVKKPYITNDSLGETPFTETLAIPGHARNHSICQISSGGAF